MEVLEKYEVLNEYSRLCYDAAVLKGFYDEGKRSFNFAEQIALVTAELSEALEAHRTGQTAAARMKNTLRPNPSKKMPEAAVKDFYLKYLKGTFEEELADAVIRLFSLCGALNFDLDFIVRFKMLYNETREYMHGKEYG
jgi:NTP pyrophosphatase (non-canonical NTP hydrolase)